LPAWLTFDTLAGTFSGTPPIIQTINVKVTATDTAGASASTSFKIIVDNPVSIDQIKGQGEGVKIFPNPSSGFINIALNSIPGKPAIVEIYNLQREVVKTGVFKKSIRLDLTGSPKGMYILKLQVDNEITVSKICIQ
jgi:hypothetical protein